LADLLKSSEITEYQFQWLTELFAHSYEYTTSCQCDHANTWWKSNFTKWGNFNHEAAPEFVKKHAKKARSLKNKFGSGAETVV